FPSLQGRGRGWVLLERLDAAEEAFSRALRPLAGTHPVAPPFEGAEWGFSVPARALIGAAMPAIEIPQTAALPADWRDFLALTKPRVMSLVVFSGLCGLLAAPAMPPLVLGFTAILCIALGAGACGALNQWYEAEL